MSHAPQRTECLVEPLPGDFLRRVAALRPRDGFWWLDSAPGHGPLGRWSLAGADPRAVVRAWGRQVRVDVTATPWRGLAPGRHDREGDPLEMLRALLPQPPDADPLPGLPFRGGAVGVLGYELAPLLAPLEPLRLRGLDETGLPDLCFLLVDRALVHDHERGESFAVALGEGADRAAARDAAAEALATLVAQSAEDPAPALALLTRDWSAPVSPKAGSASLDESAHAKAVVQVKEHIAEGDCYQACLTYRLESAFAGDPFALAAALRARNPAPFAAFLDLPGAALVSSSPERFLRIDRDGSVESRPIKGTRARGRDAAADRAARQDLAVSPKDRAENLMIVDLVRNDLGRVCETGSVSVPELMQVEAYATLFQLVSTVRGRLRSDRDRFDAIRATFPPGSMTGAPKLEAMQRLARLEPVRRGPYAGALGYLDAGGAMDLSVVIRTAIVAGGQAHVHTGGAIVADSQPGAEWAEACDKARPVLEALALAQAPVP